MNVTTPIPSMQVVPDVAAWDALLLRLPVPHLLQSATWGEFKVRWGWSVTRLAWGEPGAEFAAAQVLVRRPGPLPFRIGYVSKGPLLADASNPSEWNCVLGDLEVWALHNGLTWLKMDPDVPAASTDVSDVWARRGWRRSSEQVQFPNTMTSDLSGGEAAAWAGMKQKTRYNVGLAERRGVTVVEGGAADLATFYDLYAATGRRTGFGIRTFPYYRDIWTTLLDQGSAALFLAELNGRPLAGAIPVAFGPTAWYLYGASADEGREAMPAYAAMWAALRWAIAKGCTRFDWWGGPTVLDERDPLWGVYRFKEGFGASWVEQLGAWDFPVRPARFAAYQALATARRRWLAWRQG